LNARWPGRQVTLVVLQGNIEAEQAEAKRREEREARKRVEEEARLAAEAEAQRLAAEAERKALEQVCLLSATCAGLKSVMPASHALAP
jgi:membrane protein involved in colicin uptake